MILAALNPLTALITAAEKGVKKGEKGVKPSLKKGIKPSFVATLKLL